MTPPGRDGLLARAGGDVIAIASAAVATMAGVIGQITRAGPHLIGELLTKSVGGLAVADKLLLGHNPPTLLDRPPGIDKSAVWSRPFPLADIKRAGREAGATINDVLMSALAGAISTYVVEREGSAVTDLSTMVPVNMRPLDGALTERLGNRFAFVFMPLPVSISPPLERLAETKRRMDAIKRSPESAMTFALIKAFGLLPPAIERPIVDLLAGKAIGVTTNVAGPRSARYLAGSRVAGLLAWVSSSGRQTLGVCIVTYNDTVRVGFKVDAATIPDPERFLDALTRQIEPLLAKRRSRASKHSALDDGRRSSRPTDERRRQHGLSEAA